jgi:hypothetical protein
MKKQIIIIFLLLFIQLFFLSNLQFTLWPEMTSYAFFKNNGFTLYEDFIFPYPPLLIFILSAIYKAFGYKLLAVKLLSWSLSLVNSILIYLITKNLLKGKGIKSVSVVPLFALAFYIFLQPFLEGNMLWFDNVLVTPLLAAFYFFVSSNLALAGLFLALCALTKQTAGIFILSTFLLLLLSKRKTKEIVKFSLPSFFLGAALLLWALSLNMLSDFLNWTIIYPLTKWSSFPGYVQMALSKREALILLSLFIFPAFLLKINKKSTPLILFFTLSLLAVYPRFSFFHFQPALAFLAIAYGLSFDYFQKIQNSKTKLLLPPLSAIIFILTIYPVAKTSWHKEARFFGSQDIALARKISSELAPQETIFLLGPHSGLYALSNRLPPKPWTDNFGWYLEISGVQEEIISRWEVSPPDYILWTQPKEGNWFDLATYQPQEIVNWINSNYTKGEKLKENTYLWKKQN